MKAVLITAENQRMLMERYALVEEMFMPVGYYLVTDFGDENMDFSLLTKKNLEAQFDIGDPILNGFFAIAKKEI